MKKAAQTSRGFVAWSRQPVDGPAFRSGYGRYFRQPMPAFE